MSYDDYDDEDLKPTEELLYSLTDEDYFHIEELAQKLYLDNNSPTQGNRFRSTIHATLLYLIDVHKDEILWSH